MRNRTSLPSDCRHGNIKSAQFVHFGFGRLETTGHNQAKEHNRSAEFQLAAHLFVSKTA